MARPAASQLLPPMRKRRRRCALMIPVVAALALGLSACVGDTDPATNVTNVSAQLNAHGHTDGGPATWWWEYATVQADLGTANDTEVCGGTGPRQPDRCGPAARGRTRSTLNTSSSPGLTPNTTYYFRACGQDSELDPGSPADPSRASRRLPGRATPSTASGAARARATASSLFRSGVADRRRRATSTSPTPATTGSRSSAPPAPSSPSGAATAPATASSTSPVGRGHRLRRQRLRRRHAATTGSRSSAPPGAFITKWGSHGAGDGQFSGPGGVATDAAGNVYVADYPVRATTTASRSSTPPAPSSPSGAASARRRPVQRPQRRRHRRRRQRLRRRHRQQPHPEVQLHGHLPHQVGQLRHRRRPVQRSPAASPPTPPATSTSPTPTTTGSRSSAPPAPSSPSGGRAARATASSSMPCGVAADSVGNVYVADTPTTGSRSSSPCNDRRAARRTKQVDSGTSTSSRGGPRPGGSAPLEPRVSPSTARGARQ